MSQSALQFCKSDILQKGLILILALGLFVVSSHAVEAADCIEHDYGLSWGANASDQASWSTAVDPSGNVYVAGAFSGTVDFDPGTGTTSIASAGGDDAFLTKFNASGVHQWTHTWGSTGADASQHMAVDSSGNVFMSLEFSGTVDFNWTSGTDNHTSLGYTDLGIVKVNSNNTFGWGRAWGRNGGDSLTNLVTDSAGAVYATGQIRKYATFTTVDLNPTSGVNNHTFAGAANSVHYDIFVLKLTSAGAYVWSRLVGGAGNESGQGLAIDNSGHVYVVGGYELTSNFNLGAGTDNHTSNGGKDIFVARYRGDNGNYIRTRTMGGTGSDYAENVDVDSSNRSVTVGSFANTVDFDWSASTSNATSNGSSDLFIVRYSVTGNFVSKYTLGGTGAENGMDIVADTTENNDIRAVGKFNGTVDFDFGSGTDSRTSQGGSDVFTLLINADGTYRHVYTVGGTQDDFVLNMAQDGSQTYVAGAFSSTSIDLDPTHEIDTETNSDSTSPYTRDAFLSGFTGDYPYLGIGLRHRTASGTKSIAVQCGTVSNNSSPFRIGESSTVYAIDLVDIAADFASGIRVKTANDSIQAARVCENNCTTKGTTF